MNGPHDLGGIDGFGRVDVSESTPGWGMRVFGLMAGVLAATNAGTPAFRHAIERIAPARYLSSSYYERWTVAAASLLVEAGIIGRDELTDGFPLSAPVRARRIDDPGADVTEPRFSVGDRIIVRNVHPLGHTRCPRYVRGHAGTIVRYDGACNFDDVEAHSDTKRLEPLYCVRFDAVELWGEAAEASTISVDLFDSYLEAT